MPMTSDNGRKDLMSNSRTRTHFSVILTLLAGIAVSLLAFSMAGYWEENRLRKEFDIRASTSIGLIENVVEDNMNALRSLADFYAASDKVSRDEFRVFATEILKIRPYILEFRWLARVGRPERAAFEESARKEGLSDFEIKETNADGKLTAAAEREEYFPSFYAEPIENRKHLLGLDSSSFKERRLAMEKARDTGEAAAANEVVYIGLEEINTASRVFYPIYRNGAKTATVEDRRENLAGFIAMIYNIKMLADLSRNSLAPLGCDVYIYDDHAEKGKKLLYFQPARLRDEIPKKLPFDESQIEEKGGFLYKKSFSIADRDWTIIGRPSPKFLRQSRTYYSLIILFAGVAVTVILAIYMSTLLNRAGVIESLVTVRTAELRKSAEEWQKTFDSITDLIFIQAKDDTIVKVNKAFAAAIGSAPMDMVGKKCYEVFHCADKPWPNCPFEMTKQDKKMHMEEVIGLNAGITFSVTTSPIFNEAGELVGSVHIARDITEMKKAEDKLREAAEIKSNFTSMVSHELRTPLAAIKESIDIVADGTAGDINKAQEEFITMAKRNVDRLARLINNVLDFQKLESGKSIFDMKEDDMNEVVNEVGKQMASVAAQKGLDLKSDTADDLPKADFDRDKMIQVLTNLVNNAIKFTEKGGITIRTTKKDTMIRVSVSDTGIGIKDEDLPRLFHSFEQIATGRDRKTGGTGLGLVISQAIVEKHGGKMWAESKYGEGSTFHFVIPVKG
ncbi:MAG: CHASE domain-containing protein [Candidatus Omnitrophota bacterium]